MKLGIMCRMGKLFGYATLRVNQKYTRKHQSRSIPLEPGDGTVNRPRKRPHPLMVAIIDFFEVITNDWLVADEEGNISIMAITDDYRAGLSYANVLFEEGLFSQRSIDAFAKR